VLIALDTPFVDTVPEGMLMGKAGPAPGTPPGLPFGVHHHMLSQAGIHLVENAKLDELAADRVWTSCTMILPLREQGAAGSAIRPVAMGAPRKAAGR
jgi:kynurenine formamidase